MRRVIQQIKRTLEEKRDLKMAERVAKKYVELFDFSPEDAEETKQAHFIYLQRLRKEGLR